MKNNELSTKEQEQYIKYKGQQLGLMIAKSDLPEEVKLELVALTEKMTLEQLEKLYDIFETKLLNEATKPIDDAFQNRVNEIINNYNQQENQLNNKYQKEIIDFEKKLNK